MNYQKNISGHLALGYGSQYQLLRMLGLHRNEFNQTIAKEIGVDEEIKWFDFHYQGAEDSELLNFEFAPDLDEEWHRYWACGKTGGIHWDAVGLSADGNYILVEAKANIDELHRTSHPGGIPASVEKNDEVFRKLFAKYGIDRNPEEWDSNCYQLGNRLVALDFLLEHGKKAKLIYVLFSNGYSLNASVDKSVSKEEWEAAMDQELDMVGIKNTAAASLVHYCIIDCNR